MVKTKDVKTKLLVAMIVFMLIFSNCGFTLSAIATSDEFQVITNGFFKKDEIKFEAYFEDEEGNQVTEITGNVNKKVRLILSILPQVDGYLKTANLKAVSEDDSDVNFKITSASYYEENTLEDALEASQNVNLNVNNEENANESQSTEKEAQDNESEVTTEVADGEKIEATDKISDSE